MGDYVGTASSTSLNTKAYCNIKIVNNGFFISGFSRLTNYSEHVAKNVDEVCSIVRDYFNVTE